MCQAKLEEEDVSGGFESSVVSEHITNLAKEISRQTVEDANWLILVAYVRGLKKKKKKSQKRMDQFSSEIQRKHYGPKTVSPLGKRLSNEVPETKDQIKIAPEGSPVNTSLSQEGSYESCFIQSGKGWWVNIRKNYTGA